MKVSLIIPVYNTENYLEDCLNSAISQTLKDIEIICINDGSIDNSLKILNRYLKLDDRIVVINQYNRGLSVARNNGIKIAKGEYISFLDSDDTIDSDALSEMYYVAKNTNSDIVATQAKKIDNFGNISISAFPSFQSNSFEDILNPNFAVSVCTKLFKKELFFKFKVWFPSGFYYEDHITAIKLFFYANQISYLNKAFYNYYSRDNSITTTLTREKIEHIFHVDIDLKNFFKSQNIIKYNKYIFFKIIKLSVVYILPRVEDKNLVNLFINLFLSLENISDFIKELKSEYYGLYIEFLFRCAKLKHKQDMNKFELILNEFSIPEVLNIERIIKIDELDEMNFSRLFSRYLEKNDIHEVIIYGIGKGFLDIQPLLQEKGIKVIAVADKNINNFRDNVLKFKVISLMEYNKLFYNKNVLITSVAFYSEIRNELLEYSRKYNLPFNILDVHTILEIN